MTTAPIIFDLINGIALQVGADPEADRRYAAILAAQQQSITTAEGFRRRG